MAVVYNFGIYVFTLGLHLAALFYPKARKWVAGRRNWRRRYRLAFQKTSPVLWVHAASLGEFEQGRPIIERCRQQFPDWQIVLTFFSPSGFEVRHHYAQADFIAYLPADTPRNAVDFLDIIQPDAVVFVKYEFWFNYLRALRGRGIPTILVSALFRAQQPFFQPWGGFWREGLRAFPHFFVQNESSAQLLGSIGFQNVTVAGDTRVDRVLEIAAAAPGNGLVESFLRRDLAAPILIIGSAWEADETILASVLQNQQTTNNWKLIVAPHEPSEKNVQRLLRYPQAVRYSQAIPETLSTARLLVIDNVGMLNTLYRYGTVAYIGGGFGAGIHNTLEPAAFGLPIIFGPKYTKFEEACAFVARGAAFVVRDSAELGVVLQQLQSPEFYRRASQAALDFLEENRGATQQVVAFLEQLSTTLPRSTK